MGDDEIESWFNAIAKINNIYLDNEQARLDALIAGKDDKIAKLKLMSNNDLLVAYGEIYFRQGSTREGKVWAEIAMAAHTEILQRMG